MIPTAHLFPGLHARLVSLLRGLRADDWERPTVAGAWRVRDVAAHLLDVQVRRVSVGRDGHAIVPEGDLSRYDDLVAWLDALNASWIRTMRRVSPRVLIELLEVVGPRMAEVVSALDPEGPAPFPVAWAGEAESKNWFDVGRDYTELWHHQAQIRLAVGAPPLDGRAWLHPVLRLAVLALAPALNDARRPDGTALVLRIEGEAGGVWSAIAHDGHWSVLEGGSESPAAEVSLPAEAAWRVFFNAMSPDEARAASRAQGDAQLVDAVLGMRSVMV